MRTHPETGRPALYVNEGFTTGFKELKRAESDALLAFLVRHCAAPEFQCRFRWRADSIAFWDNRCTQHHAVWDYYPETRHGYRVTIQGDRPFYAPAGTGAGGGADVGGRAVDRASRRVNGRFRATAGASRGDCRRLSRSRRGVAPAGSRRGDAWGAADAGTVLAPTDGMERREP